MASENTLGPGPASQLSSLANMSYSPRCQANPDAGIKGHADAALASDLMHQDGKSL